ncbi:MAG: hypothetical protein ACKVJC_04385 [Flavobacteriales bacterium]|tara:strand:- start:247 stop:723 length:477 start_codon:yes stop_codon:yes gene_type:complete
MKFNYLFPHYLKRVGFVLLALGVVALLYSFLISNTPDFMDFSVYALIRQRFLSPVEFFSVVETNFLDELIAGLLILGLGLISFSREKVEDEFIAKTRLESLVWATYLNYGVLLLSVLFVYEMAFFMVMIVNMFTILIFFVIRFNWVMSKSKRQLRHEE